jgi:uncharacterized C2H2 Zn-finger protein
VSLWWGGLLGAGMVAALIVFARVGRAPRCPCCRMVTTVVADEVVNAFPPVFEITYQCQRCGEVFRSRSANVLWE